MSCFVHDPEHFDLLATALIEANAIPESAAQRVAADLFVMNVRAYFDRYTVTNEEGETLRRAAEAYTFTPRRGVLWPAVYNAARGYAYQADQGRAWNGSRAASYTLGLIGLAEARSTERERDAAAWAWALTAANIADAHTPPRDAPGVAPASALAHLYEGDPL